MTIMSETFEHAEDQSHTEGLPSTNDLFNEATMWLQYARGVTATLADLIHEAEDVDTGRLSLSLEAVAAMMLLSARQLGEARARASWDAVKSA
jgi:hypothetical protein